MFLMLRSVFWTAVMPGVVAGYIPWRYFGFHVGWTELSPAGVVGLLLIAAGIVFLVWSIVEFARRGRGTLSPVDPPNRLVVSGLYRWVRNPMYVGVTGIVVGESVVSRSPALVLYATGFFLLASVFIIGYEEPHLQRRFGESYEEYRRHVRRWIPRLTPWPH